MRKSFVTAIAAVATFALLGVAVTQFVWVERAIKLRTQQFDNAIYYGEVAVIDKIDGIRKDTLLSWKHRATADSCVLPPDAGLDYPYLLDSLLEEEFGCLRIQENYAWAILDTLNDTLVFSGGDSKYRQELFGSGHTYSAAALFSDQPQFILSVYFPEERQLIVRKMFLWVLILSGVFLLVVIVSFLVFILTIMKQKKLSEMKNDFINNMTHEFKTPISTISVASEMLMKPAIQSSSEKTSRYANVIFDENLRLRNQVEQVLNISMLEKSEFKLKVSPVDIHRIIENTIDIFKVILKDHSGVVHADLYAIRSEIEADEVHVINMFSNLLDNALKYSGGRPEISITTRDAEKGIVIIISDKGIGISSENIKHIFRKFYRVHTGDVHDVKGFGLGLFYVKTVVDAHKGYIKVKSELKKGSTFEVYLPYKSSSTDHD